MTKKNVIKNLFGAGLMVGIALFLYFVSSPRGLLLMATGEVPIYATQEDVMQSPPPKEIARLSAGESVELEACINVKHYLIYKVQLSDGRNGFVLDGDYVIAQDGEPVSC